MRSSIFENLAWKKGFEIPKPPEKQDSALAYIYRQGIVTGSGRVADLPGWLPQEVQDALDEATDQGTVLASLADNGYVVETVDQEEEHVLAVEQHKIDLAAFHIRVYDLLCGPTLVGIEQTDVTHTLFRLALKFAQWGGDHKTNGKFLPAVGLRFYEFCHALQEETKALLGCYESDFYGVENLWGVNFGYSDLQGFLFGIEKFWANLDYYKVEDHPAIAKILISKIEAYNRDRDRDRDSPVDIPDNLFDLSCRDAVGDVVLGKEEMEKPSAT